MSEPRWPPLESNPATMNKFLRALGLPSSVQCVDVLGFDDELLAMLPQPVYAIIFLFPGFEKYEESAKKVYAKLKSEGAGVPPNLFFMEQHIGNACGTFALFHAVANNADKFDLGSGIFRKFYDAAKGVAPADRWKCLTTDELSKAHSECASAGDTAMVDKCNHHFISYVAKDGKLYEFDSGESFPRPLADCTADSFTKTVAKECQQFMKNFPEQIGFSAIALVGSG